MPLPFRLLFGGGLCGLTQPGAHPGCLHYFPPHFSFVCPHEQSPCPELWALVALSLAMESDESAQRLLGLSTAVVWLVVIASSLLFCCFSFAF